MTAESPSRSEQAVFLEVRPDARMPHELTLPRSRRLTLPSEFERVRKNGTVTRGQLISLAVLPVDSGENRRVGFIASRRVGGAVARNRVRRRLREIFRLHQAELVTNAWILTIASARAAGASYRALEDEWLRLAARASILTA